MSLRILDLKEFCLKFNLWHFKVQIIASLLKKYNQCVSILSIHSPNIYCMSGPTLGQALF